MCPLVTHHDLGGASDTIATKPTSGGQRNVFLTLDTLLSQKVLTRMCTHAHAWHCCLANLALQGAGKVRGQSFVTTICNKQAFIRLTLQGRHLLRCGLSTPFGKGIQLNSWCIPFVILIYLQTNELVATFSTTGSMGNKFWGKRWIIVCRWDRGFFIPRRLNRGCWRAWRSCWWLLRRGGCRGASVSTVVVVGYEACNTCLVAALLVAHHASPSLQRLLKIDCRHGVSLGCTKGAKQGPNKWYILQRGHTNDETQRTINTLFSVARTNMVPTTVALRQMLSWVPTPIALRRLHVLWFRFRHTQVWVWAPCWPLKHFAKGTAPWSTCLRKMRKNVASPTRGATQKSVDCESLTPTRGATQQSVDCESQTPTRGATQKSVDCESLTPTRGATQKSVDCESLTPTRGATQKSVDCESLTPT